MVCRLYKALYGLKKAPRAWYERLHAYLIKIGFKKINDNSILYIREGPKNKILLAEIFMDDIIFTRNDDLHKQFSEEMSREFEMSLFGQIKFFIGVQIQLLKDWIYVSQSKYVNKILKKFGMEDSKPMSTPMTKGLKLSKKDDSKVVDQTTYRSMIGKLQYALHSRSDIVLAVGIVARFSANPKETHLMEIKRILRYLTGTID